VVNHDLGPVMALLGGGLAAVGLSRVTRLNAIVCYFIVGALIGDYGFGLVSYEGEVQLLAEIGLAFFLYEVGSHLSLKKLAKEWRVFLSLGPLHTVGVSLGVGVLAYFFGFSVLNSVLLGAVASISSTAVVLKMLEERGESMSPAGQSTVAILLFQDIFAVILLALIPALSGSDTSQLLPIVFKTLGFTALAFVGVIVSGRLIFKPFFRWVFSQRADEVFTASALFSVLVVAWAVGPLGLSLPLGAFLAGVALAETNYSYLIRSELLPFRALLLSLFFLSVGMSLNFYFLLSNLPALLLLTLAITALKVTFGALALRLSGMAASNCVKVSFSIGQGSEFSFALIAALSLAGLISQSDVGMFAGIVGVSLSVSALVATLGGVLSRVFAKPVHEDQVTPGLANRAEVVIVEFGVIGAELASAFDAEGIPYRVHDRDWQRIAEAKTQGYNVYFSDPDRPRTLARASLGEVSAVISLLEDSTVSLALVGGLKKVAPNVPIVAATASPSLLETLIELGVERSFLKNEHTAELILKEALTALGYSISETAQAIARHRARKTGNIGYSELARVA